MVDVNRELNLEELPPPPLFTLVEGSGEGALEETAVGGEPSTVGALFETRELAEEFSAGAGGFGMGGLSGLGVRELSGWAEVEAYAASGADFVLVVTGSGTGLFHAGDVARHAAERAGEVPFPLYLFSDQRGEAPLISVDTGGEGAVAAEKRETDATAPSGETLVAALFSSPERARAFRERAPHLNLPDRLATIEDRDGLRRHALVAREAGAAYAVFDPGSGLTEAIPVEDLIR
jgi:hypothetical protein